MPGLDLVESGRILVVDDDASIRLLARATLLQAGYLVSEAADGESVLEAFQRDRPDVVLLDVMLPGIDGFAVCAAIRALPEGKDIPIVMMTGLDDNEAIMQAFRAGATDFITKPVSWQTLAYRIHYIFKASQAFRDLRASEAQLSQAQRIARMGSWEWDALADRLRLSDTCRAILGLSDTSSFLPLAALTAIVHPHDTDKLTRAITAICTTLEPLSTDFRTISGEGTERYLHAEAVALRDPKTQSVKINGTFQDITQQRQSEEQIRFLAYYDGLTGLPNRLLFKEHLQRAMHIAKRTKRKLAILFLDLDRFKGINDSFGHTIGDLLLQGVAERLHQSIRRSDTICRKSLDKNEWTLARLGGDEFMILLDGISSAEDIAIVSRRIIDAFAQPFTLNTLEVFVTCSIGISVYPDDASEVDELVKDADIAMYSAKELGRNTFQFFTSEMNTVALQRLMMENLLRRAIERNEFILHYQPQVDSVTGRIVGLEALVRWQSTEMGLVSPASFIPLAEESGLIVSIDEWVLATVCRQLSVWHNEGVLPVRVAVNLSGRHFQKTELPATVSRILAETGAPAHLLELELTEGVVMLHAAETVSMLTDLRKMGICISIDDFGTGYSSLSYLKRFPLTTLKIDRAFIQEIGRDGKGTAIIKAIIALGRGLGLEIIAEGVETAPQLAFLQEHDCTIIQGFLYSPPLPLDGISALLKGEKQLPNIPPHQPKEATSQAPGRM